MPYNKDLIKNTDMYLLDDSDLEAVGGGYRVMFDEEGLNRDSWFVSLLTRRLIENKIRRELEMRPGNIPSEIEIEGRRFRVTPVGEDFHVEELL
ncbi:MAG: hypothetical protein IJL40_04285 [Oscillospiraceae bacterium]|nr:hypothetical protein [Oscillospiraceae bacterium]MBQ6215012.1 hypothetical protein [Oscillospiraceae bacterium]